MLGAGPAEVEWLDEHRGRVRHFFHLAALYDMTAPDELSERLNIGGTRAALDLAAALEGSAFHHVYQVFPDSPAAKGDHEGGSAGGPGAHPGTT